MKSKAVEQAPQKVREDLFHLGQAIKEGRAAKGLTQDQLAARLQISRTTLRAAEQGDPSVKAGILLTLLWALGIGPLASALTPHGADWTVRTGSSRQRVRPKALDDF